MRVATGWTQRINGLWERFGVLVKDERVKVIVYPLVVVLGVILVAFGGVIVDRFFGDYYLAVQVSDENGKPLDKASVGIQPEDGVFMEAQTDPIGVAAFTIKHANMGTKPRLWVSVEGFPVHEEEIHISQRKENIPIKLSKSSQTHKVIYRAPNNNFWEMNGDRWVEHSMAHPEALLTFREVRRDSDYIYLVDPSRVKPGETDNPLLLRLPIKGGTAQWSWQNPIAWIDLTLVTPE